MGEGRRWKDKFFGAYLMSLISVFFISRTFGAMVENRGLKMMHKEQHYLVNNSLEKLILLSSIEKLCLNNYY